MRLVKEGFAESIPTAVIRVYSVALTIAGDDGLRDATHLERLPKTLTSPFDARLRLSFGVAGSEKSGGFGRCFKGEGLILNLLTSKNFRVLRAACLEPASSWSGRTHGSSMGQNLATSEGTKPYCAHFPSLQG